MGKRPTVQRRPLNPRWSPELSALRAVNTEGRTLARQLNSPISLLPVAPAVGGGGLGDFLSRQGRGLAWSVGGGVRGQPWPHVGSAYDSRETEVPCSAPWGPPRSSGHTHRPSSYFYTAVHRCGFWCFQEGHLVDLSPCPGVELIHATAQLICELAVL